MTSNETTYSLERLRALRTEIAVTKRGGHNQSYWGTVTGQVEETYRWRGHSTMGKVECPSSACAAGWTVVNEKAHMLVAIGPDMKARDTVRHCLTPEGVVREIMPYAAELLGLSRIETAVLFNSGPSTEETLARIDQLIVAAAHGRTWDEQRRLQGLPPLDDLPCLEWNWNDDD